MKRLFFLFPLAVSLLSSTLHAEERRTSLAMHGEAKEAADFTHFRYTNPNAPKGGTLKLGVVGSFDSLHPFIVRGQSAYGLTTGAGVMSLITETLMTRNLDEPFTLYPLLAENIDLAEDRSTITFHLNPAARFSDDVSVTADDILFSWETLRKQGRPNHRLYDNKIEKAEKLDTQSVRFTFKHEADGSLNRELPMILALMPVLPKHDWDGRDFNHTNLRPPIGSGPYRLTKVDIGRSVTYTRNPTYWGRDIPTMKGLYNFDEIRVDYYRDDNIALQAFKAGQFDLRREMDPNKWATAYDFPATRDGRVKAEQMPHSRTEPAYGFIFNTRRTLFKDKALRTALSYAFDFGWINKNLFHGQYHPTTSFFPNSELAAPTLPDEREKEILQKYKTSLSPEIFTETITLPPTDGSPENRRHHLLKASQLLKEAGYTLPHGILTSPQGEPVTFEILLQDPTEEKIALTWIRELKQLGVEAHAHTVDSAQYQRRLTAFDYDVTTARWFNSLSPGNEQSFYWSSALADQQGSRNYPGVRDPVVDALANALPAATSREELVATTHALDRVLMAGHYVVPFYYLGADDVAYWQTHLQHPTTVPINGVVFESWWAR